MELTPSRVRIGKKEVVLINKLALHTYYLLLSFHSGLCKDSRLVPGGGATEMELARHITNYGETCPGMEQYAIKKFADALTYIPRILAENSGIKGRQMISVLAAAHEQGQSSAAVDIDQDKAAVIDAEKQEILDLLLAKHWAIKFAVNAACTILRVDQIIMAKRAGGPKPRPGGGPMDHGDED